MRVIFIFLIDAHSPYFTSVRCIQIALLRAVMKGFRLRSFFPFHLLILKFSPCFWPLSPLKKSIKASLATDRLKQTTYHPSFQGFTIFYTLHLHVWNRESLRHLFSLFENLDWPSSYFTVESIFVANARLKEYSVILTAPFYGINQKILTKKIISKISVHSDFSFTSYVWLCAMALLHRLLC